MEVKEYISIRFPKTDSVNKLSEQNPHLQLRKGSGNNIVLRGEGFSIQEKRLFPLNLNGFSESLYEQTTKLNLKKEFRIQYAGNLIYLKLGTFGLISAYAASVMAGLYWWTEQTKSGRVYTGEGEYKLPNFGNVNDYIRVRPCLSFISFNKTPEATQNQWLHSFIDVPPTLAIEIVSAKYSLKEAQEKMQHVWMRSGAEIGIVIYPFGKKIYIYEKGKTKAKLQSILKPFTHKLLPGYSGDFGAFADEF